MHFREVQSQQSLHPVLNRGAPNFSCVITICLFCFYSAHKALANDTIVRVQQWKTMIMGRNRCVGKLHSKSQSHAASSTELVCDTSLTAQAWDSAPRKPKQGNGKQAPQAKLLILYGRKSMF